MYVWGTLRTCTGQHEDGVGNTPAMDGVSDKLMPYRLSVHKVAAIAKQCHFNWVPALCLDTMQWRLRWCQFRNVVCEEEEEGPGRMLCRAEEKKGFSVIIRASAIWGFMSQLFRKGWLLQEQDDVGDSRFSLITGLLHTTPHPTNVCNGLDKGRDGFRHLHFEYYAMHASSPEGSSGLQLQPSRLRSGLKP